VLFDVLCSCVYVNVVWLSVHVYAGWLRWLGCSGLEQVRQSGILVFGELGIFVEVFI